MTQGDLSQQQAHQETGAFFELITLKIVGNQQQYVYNLLKPMFSHVGTLLFLKGFIIFLRRLSVTPQSTAVSTHKPGAHSSSFLPIHSEVGLVTRKQLWREYLHCGNLQMPLIRAIFSSFQTLCGMKHVHIGVNPSASKH